MIADAHDGGFQWARPAQLTHARFNAVERAKDQDRTRDPGCPPSGNRLQVRQDVIKALPQISYHVIMVKRQTMPRVQR